MACLSSSSYVSSFSVIVTTLKRMVGESGTQCCAKLCIGGNMETYTVDALHKGEYLATLRYLCQVAYQHEIFDVGVECRQHSRRTDGLEYHIDEPESDILFLRVAVGHFAEER